MTAVLEDKLQSDVTYWVDFGGREVGFEFGMLTPARAQDLVDNYNNRNRKINKRDVLKYSRDMTDGLWRLTGEPIIVGEDGNMENGQHRCLAVIDSKVSVPMLFIYNIGSDSMSAIDQNRPRTVTDILTVGGSATDIPNKNDVGSAARLLMMGDRALSKHTLNRQRIAAYAEENAERLVDASMWAKTVYNVAPPSQGATPSSGKCVAPAPLAVLSLTMETLGGRRADVRRFFEKVVGKERALDDAEHRSMVAVRTYLQRTPLNRSVSGGNIPGLMAAFEALIRVYNRVQSGEPVKRVATPDNPVRWMDELPRVGRV